MDVSASPQLINWRSVAAATNQTDQEVNYSKYHLALACKSVLIQWYCAKLSVSVSHALSFSCGQFIPFYKIKSKNEKSETCRCHCHDQCLKVFSLLYDLCSFLFLFFTVSLRSSVLLLVLPGVSTSPTSLGPFISSASPHSPVERCSFSRVVFFFLWLHRASLGHSSLYISFAATTPLCVTLVTVNLYFLKRLVGLHLLGQTSASVTITA